MHIRGYEGSEEDKILSDNNTSLMKLYLSGHFLHVYCIIIELPCMSQTMYFNSLLAPCHRRPIWAQRYDGTDAPSGHGVMMETQGEPVLQVHRLLILLANHASSYDLMDD